MSSKSYVIHFIKIVILCFFFQVSVISNVKVSTWLDHSLYVTWRFFLVCFVQVGYQHVKAAGFLMAMQWFYQDWLYYNCVTSPTLLKWDIMFCFKFLFINSLLFFPHLRYCICYMHPSKKILSLWAKEWCWI